MRADLAEATRSQHAARSGATHAETRAEGPKDMRSTEASYLARGLAERVEDLGHTLAALETFRAPDFGAEDAIGLGALVLLEDEAGAHRIVWIVPAGGGESLEVGGLRIHTLTPGTPLGAVLGGRRFGDTVLAPSARGARETTIVALR